MAGTNDSPEQMAERLGLTIQYALIDFDIHDPTLQVIGGDPVDLSEIPHEYEGINLHLILWASV